jgi:hypothetical protein
MPGSAYAPGPCRYSRRAAHGDCSVLCFAGPAARSAAERHMRCMLLARARCEAQATQSPCLHCRTAADLTGINPASGFELLRMYVTAGLYRLHLLTSARGLSVGIGAATRRGGAGSTNDTARPRRGRGRRGPSAGPWGATASGFGAHSTVCAMCNGRGGGSGGALGCTGAFPFPHGACTQARRRPWRSSSRSSWRPCAASARRSVCAAHNHTSQVAVDGRTVQYSTVRGRRRGAVVSV